jgi:hypothetical protein
MTPRRLAGALAAGTSEAARRHRVCTGTDGGDHDRPGKLTLRDAALRCSAFKRFHRQLWPTLQARAANRHKAHWRE